MTLEQFVAEMQFNVRRFAKRWVKANANDPDNWPLDMAAGDWYENFDWKNWGDSEDST